MSFMNNKGIPNALTGGQGGMMNALSSLDMKPGMNKPVAQGQGGALTNVLSSIENWGQNNLRRGSGPLAEAFHGFAQGFAPQQYENARQGRMGEIAQEQAQRGNVQQQITGMNEQQAQMQREMQESALAMGQHLLTMPEEQRVAFVRQNWQRFGPMVSGGKNNMSFEQWMAQDPTGLSDMDLQNDITAAMTQMRQGPQYEVTNDQYIRMDQGAPRVALDARDAVTVDPGDRLATQTGQVLLGPDEDYVGRENRTLDIRQQEADTGRINANKPSGPLVSISEGGGNSAFMGALGDAAGNRYNEVIERGAAADRSLANADMMGNLINQMDYTGWGGDALTYAQQMGRALGMEFEGLGARETMQRLTSEMAMSLKDNLPGPMSDGDRQFLLSIPPNLNTSREGNLALLYIQRERARYEQAMRDSLQRVNPQTMDQYQQWESRFAQEYGPIFDPVEIQQMNAAMGVN